MISNHCRYFLGAALAGLLIPGAAAAAAPGEIAAKNPAQVREIGSRLELFVDDLLLASADDGVKLKPKRPRPENAVMSDDKPWEGPINYFSVLKGVDGKYLMYYRGYYLNRKQRASPICFAWSDDGITWTKPELGLFDWRGRGGANNIVIGGDYRDMFPTARFKGTLPKEIFWIDALTPFVDEKAPAAARYRSLIRGGVAGGREAGALYTAHSPDGIEWHIGAEPVITRGHFDSQNTVMYDSHFKRYAAFVRDSQGLDREAPGSRGVIMRDIRVAFSDDFVKWSDPVFVNYLDGDYLQLYTNAIVPYERAPHLLVGFPTTYMPGTVETGGLGQTEPIFMVSRDGGTTWLRWPEAVIPRDAPSERDGNRANYMAQGLLFANEREMYCYATEGHVGTPTRERRLRRFVWRTDGFVALGGTGKAETVLLKCAGDQLTLNYTGKVRVEVLDARGEPMASKAFDGDEIAASMPTPGIDGPVRLRFTFDGGELFSFRFGR